MAAAECWQALYHKTARLVAASSWAPLDTASIFAHLDVFVQRCRDLHDVCAAQLQFSAPADARPAFGGCYAPELSKRIADIQV
jgi:dynein heavy chain